MLVHNHRHCHESWNHSCLRKLHGLAKQSPNHIVPIPLSSESRNSISEHNTCQSASFNDRYGFIRKSKEIDELDIQSICPNRNIDPIKEAIFKNKEELLLSQTISNKINLISNDIKDYERHYFWKFYAYFSGMKSFNPKNVSFEEILNLKLTKNQKSQFEHNINMTLFNITFNHFVKFFNEQYQVPRLSDLIHLKEGFLFNDYWWAVRNNLSMSSEARQMMKCINNLSDIKGLALFDIPAILGNLDVERQVFSDGKINWPNEFRYSYLTLGEINNCSVESGNLGRYYLKWAHYLKNADSLAHPCSPSQIGSGCCHFSSGLWSQRPYKILEILKDSQMNLELLPKYDKDLLDMEFTIESRLEPMWTDMGTCYTLNSKTHFQIFKESYYKNEFNKVYGGRQSVRIKNNPFMTSKRHYVLLIKRTQNFAKIFFSINDLHIPFNVISNKFELFQGDKITIKIEPIKYETDPKVRKLDPLVRNCYFRDEKDVVLKLMKYYSQKGCEFECMLNEARRICQCDSWNYPSLSNHSNFRFCDLFGNYCFRKVFTSFHKYGNCSYCLPNCEYIKYKSFVIEREMRRRSDIKANTKIVLIIDDETIVIKKKILHSLTNKISSIGNRFRHF